MKHINDFFDGINVIGLLPCWVLAGILWRIKHGKWTWTSPVAYAANAAAEEEWLVFFIGLALWLIPVVLIFIFR